MAMKRALLLLIPLSLAAHAQDATAPRHGPSPKDGGMYIAPAPAYPIALLPALPAPEDQQFYAERAVPHRTVEVVKYRTTAGTEKQMHVYLPPGYATETERRYPVLYLNHGGGENDACTRAYL